MSTKKKAKAEEAPTDTDSEAAAAAAEPAEESPAEYNPARLITPQEACSYHGGNTES